jgi:hypothetical protein
MNKELTCKTCRHNRASWLERTFNVNTWAWECNKGYKEPEYNPVTGKTTPGRHESCGVVRVMSKVCGPEATAWQPYYRKDLFKYIKIAGYKIDK